jgi:peptidoglycan-N-acetylglucosamine deacetylase
MRYNRAMRKGKMLYLFFCLVVLLVILAYSLFEISNSRTFQFFGGITARVETDKKLVALTFDDAPTKFSNDVLKELDAKDVKATFYMIGEYMEKDPEAAKAIAQAGMELGNHSYSHQRFYFKSQSFIDHEIQTTNKLIRDAGYSGEITFRPPNGKKLIGLPYYLNQKGIKTIMWDVEPDTYVSNELDERAKTEFIVRHTLDNTKPGSIILLHPFCEQCTSDRHAIPEIIEALRKKGYTFVTVSELLKHDTSK